MLFRPLSWVPLDVLARLWIVLSLLLLARVCLLLVRATGSTTSAEGRDALVVLCAAMLAEPLSSTLGYGQVNVLLLWLVVEDLLGYGVRTGARRRTTGVLTGIAAGIKVTPLLLVAYLAVVGRARDAGRALLAFLATVAVAAAVVPHTAWAFWTHALWQPDRAGEAALANNQSVAAALTRLVHHDLPGRLWLLPAVLVAVASLVVARRLHARGDDVLALGSAVLGMLLASPISWTHHWVWALVPAVALWRASRGGRVLAATFLVLSVTALIYLPQHRGTPDLDWSAWEQVVGNGYALWALVSLVWCAQRSRRPTPADAMLVPCPAT